MFAVYRQIIIARNHSDILIRCSIFLFIIMIMLKTVEFVANSKCVFMCLHWREDWVLPHRHKAQIGEVLKWCLSFCRCLSSPHLIMELKYSDHRVLSHQTNQSPSPSIAQFGQKASSRNSPGSSFDLRAWFLLWYALSAVRHFIKTCGPLQINWICHRLTSLEV